MKKTQSTWPGIGGLITGLLLVAGCSAPQYYTKSETEPPSHEIWTQQLQKYVRDNGSVNYEAWQNDREGLDTYTKRLSENPPSEAWSREEQLAYWINAYNAFTVQLILDNYPLNSIQDLNPSIKIPFVNNVFSKNYIPIDGKKLSLSQIEHGVLREYFDEPRIHFAINCASVSCPILRNEAFVVDRLDEQLDAQARVFINDGFRNEISPDSLELSSIFNWFKGDFTKNGTLVEYINPYTDVDINADAAISHNNYNWSINSVGNEEMK